ncbi:MAG: Spx/MgsR family RNA polymerase-binding regulatory protein [Pseudohongiellaceae bacterium]|nr:Spx/MgsR family RNA polymerase-binding regulatory protein [Pseudohongiellaceae bacterium]
MLTMFGIANCDTIKKTKKLLAELGVEFEFHDYKKKGIDSSLGQELVDAIPLEQLVNKRGTTWRKLSEHQQQSLSKDTALSLIQDNTSLVRRPILRKGNAWLAGYDAQAIEAFVQSH